MPSSGEMSSRAVIDVYKRQHKKPVLLGLIPQALPVCEELGGFILVGGFQIAGPFLRIGMDGEEKLDLLFLVLEVVILVGDDGHDLLFI